MLLKDRAIFSFIRILFHARCFVRVTLRPALMLLAMIRPQSCHPARTTEATLDGNDVAPSLRTEYAAATTPAAAAAAPPSPSTTSPHSFRTPSLPSLLPPPASQLLLVVASNSVVGLLLLLLHFRRRRLPSRRRLCRRPSSKQWQWLPLLSLGRSGHLGWAEDLGGANASQPPYPFKGVPPARGGDKRQSMRGSGAKK